MRQRVQGEGFEGMEPHEIIEFLLYYAIPRQDVNELAHLLIDRFGGLQGVLSADPRALRDVPGVGPRTADLLAQMGELTAACAELEPCDRPWLRNYRYAIDYALRIEPEMIPPCCMQLCLDTGGRLVYRRRICDSLSWGEPATLRDALRDMLVAQAQDAVLLIYTGDRIPEPQSYDIEHISDYKITLIAARCHLLDTIFVSGGTPFSMSRDGPRTIEDELPLLRALREYYLRPIDDPDPD